MMKLMQRSGLRSAWTLLTLLSLCVIWAWLTPAYANDSANQKVQGNFAGADYWREVSDGTEGYTTSKSAEHGQLINIDGERWRQWRNEWISPAGLIAIGGSLGLLTLVYLLLGKMKLDKPRTGRVIERWKRFDRAMHWYVAISFLILAFSGLLILYGKHFVPDLLGYTVWKNLIALSKLLHNYIGPLFAIGLLVMIVRWIGNNFFNLTDLKWFLQGGGLIGGKHPSAGFLNGGEKGWFWALTLLGLVVVGSGLVLDFPIFGQTRDDMQWANLIHAGTSLLLFAISLGHIYIGTIGSEGALEGMKTGYVDETWAKQHHDLWYNEVKDQAIDAKELK
ncbi:formate dehydrogenase gamma subunit [Oceanospirillum multiglobuliferum]|uniref:Formate dehydrogenase subunit gamma n=1 Tax=Oceanospirillum multiglobuliferum TaxID=64969 RepID=A0A1T4S7S4_9GAMM|nr:formate dehydrogenase subunit gamma [Oceanospirillum multiglobuliferum]OPX54423.1 formate dehydrogenase subunit gamma [Oceanospirillum multiglobuliferum]SKA23958.1 formate dehydrogenase gamma subunit [Oceanospirillum multiglobuliferum]